MARGDALEARNLAAHPDMAERALDRPLQRRGQLGDARGPARCRPALRLLASPAVGEGIVAHMNVLLIGSGGREHALAWKLAQSPRLDASSTRRPGNPGIAEHAELVALDPADHRGGASISAAATRSALVVIGPERRWSTGSPTICARWASLVFGPNRTPPSSKARRASPRICARGTTSRPPAMPAPPTGRGRGGARAISACRW